MAERKVFNKYIPPDFDPLLLPKGERPANNQIKLRNMLPMTICCNTCGEYMGRGTKFNSRQEIAQGMDWKGIKRWRFYIKCSSCSSEMTFLTDPEHDHYVPEHGCSSMTEPWRAKIEAEEAYIRSRENEELGDDIKALENRSKETKYQLDLMDTIADLQEHNKRNTFLNVDKVLQVMHNSGDHKNSNGENSREIEEQINQYRAHQSKRRKLMNADNNTISLASPLITIFNNNNNTNQKDIATTTIGATPLSTPTVQFQFGGNSRRDKTATAATTTTTTTATKIEPTLFQPSNKNMTPNNTNSISSTIPTPKNTSNLHDKVILKKRKKAKKAISSENSESKKKKTTTTTTAAPKPTSTNAIEKSEEKKTNEEGNKEINGTLNNNGNIITTVVETTNPTSIPTTEKQ